MTHLIRRSKKHLSIALLLLTSFVTSHGQIIESDDQLLQKAKDYYDNNSFRDAEVYFFAYIQRNTQLYQGDADFRNSLWAAFQYAHKKRATLEGKADIHTVSTSDGDHNNSGKPIVNVGGNGPQNVTISTNTFSCNDGGTYYVRTVGNDVWWFGKSDANGFGNVFHGTIMGDIIYGHWADVPYARTANFGEMHLKIVNANHFVSILKTGGFGGSDWVVPMATKVPSKAAMVKQF